MNFASIPFFTLIPSPIMTTPSAVALYSTLITFSSSCKMHPSIDRYKKYIETISTDGGIPIYDHHQLPLTLYIPGRHLFLTTEGITFKIHRYFIDCNSDWFLSINNNRQLNNDIFPSRLSPLDAIPLPGVSAKQFASMLWVIYNPNYGTHSTTINEWDQILVAATLLECEQITKLATFKLRVLQHCKPDCSSEAKDVFHA